MKQKVVWPLNLQYQVWEISEKCTHPFGKSCVEPFVCLPNWGFFPSENIYLEKKECWEYLFQCSAFLHCALNVVSVVFGLQSLNQQHSNEWLSSRAGYVHVQSEGPMATLTLSFGSNFLKVPPAPVLHCFLIALILQGMLVKRVGPSFIVCWWFSSSIFITDLSCCCNGTTLQL